jgi:hypothetical protein
LTDGQGKEKSAAKGISLAQMKHAKIKNGLFLESRTDKGSDMRELLFESANNGSSTVLRQGIMPFASGAAKGRWPRYRMIRTMKRTTENKRQSDGEGLVYQ